MTNRTENKLVIDLPLGAWIFDGVDMHEMKALFAMPVAEPDAPLSPTEAKLLSDSLITVAAAKKASMEKYFANWAIIKYRLYRQSHKSFEEYAPERLGKAAKTIYRQAAYAEFLMGLYEEHLPMSQWPGLSLFKQFGSIPSSHRRTFWTYVLEQSPAKEPGHAMVQRKVKDYAAINGIEIKTRGKKLLPEPAPTAPIKPLLTLPSPPPTMNQGGPLHADQSQAPKKRRTPFVDSRRSVKTLTLLYASILILILGRDAYYYLWNNKPEETLPQPFFENSISRKMQQEFLEGNHWNENHVSTLKNKNSGEP